MIVVATARVRPQHSLQIEIKDSFSIDEWRKISCKYQKPKDRISNWGNILGSANRD